MKLFVATMQIIGVVIGFVTLRVLIIPLFEREVDRSSGAALFAVAVGGVGLRRRRTR